ncbi:C-C chemokine receptor type 5-like [Scleropages formosus]|uniref:Chemokine (C-C motif) receptor 2 n=1 Tax=Scleropages formosus TaxID=113540 RepID=A0A8C9QTE0_SCLFO|nr:C-C chemokine receptor type 5-like [Scleropages formosus]
MGDISNDSVTQGYDYSEYYSHNSDDSTSPCNNGEVRKFGSIFLPTLYGIVFVVGFVGNGLVVCVLKQQKSMTMTDMCLLNLAVSDLLFVISLPFWAHEAAVSSWEFGKFMCVVVTVLHVMGFYANIFFIVIMSVDRYMIIVHAITVARFRSFKLGVILIAIVWAISFWASLPTAVFTRVKNESGFKCETAFPEDNKWRLFTYYELNVFGLIIPLIVMIFCYSKIIPTLVNIKTNKKHRAIKLVLLIVLIFFFFWTPYNIVVFLNSLRYLDYFSNCDSIRAINYGLYWTQTLAFTHCCLNPVIYAFAGQKFKKLVLKLLQKWLPVCFTTCRISESFNTEVSERRSSFHSRSSEITSARLL